MTAFLDGSENSRRALAGAVAQAAEMVGREFASRPGPYSGASPQDLEELLSFDVAPERGSDIGAVIGLIGERVIRNSIDVAHPRCAAHLHCPPLIAACAAELVIAATNQSMDSWDQSPGATHLEQRVLDWLGAACALGDRADGIFTSGATQSNLMGLLLARDRAAARLGWSVTERGLPPEAGTFRIVCSGASHFSLLQSARLLGLGEVSIVAVDTDDDGRLGADAAESAISALKADGLMPIAVVGTAGTTDLGAMDPLGELAAVARRHDAWFHVDAAVGGVFVTSDRERHRLAGLELADSLAIDFHKLWFQPISCGAFLVRDAAEMKAVLLHADYLNPEPQEDGTAFPNLVDKSLQTTRRFDALKLVMSLHVHGRRFFGEAAEAIIDLTREAARLVDAADRLELARAPQLNTVLFRYVAEPRVRDALNMSIRRDLLLAGDAVVAQTRLAGETWLKLTLMNPLATPADVQEILALVVAAGEARQASSARSSSGSVTGR